MAVGYTFGMARKVKAADGALLGVRLGRLCVKKDVSVSYVAAELGVSRQAVYNWFQGKFPVHPDYVPRAQTLLAKLRAL
jgi:transcriptional regulator with XRE-family HTH domain